MRRKAGQAQMSPPHGGFRLFFKVWQNGWGGPPVTLLKHDSKDPYFGVDAMANRKIPDPAGNRNPVIQTAANHFTELSRVATSKIRGIKIV